MKSAVALLAASAALARAQATYNQTTGTFACAKPNVDYCAGDSLKTDIIIRCSEKGVGQPGRCSDNLDGEPPRGDFPALCWQTSPTSGDAACEKNCVVYGGSGNANGTFTLPADECTPTYTASSSASSVPSTSSTSGSTSTSGSLAGGSSATTTAESTTTTTSCPTLGTGSGGGSGAGNSTSSAVYHTGGGSGGSSSSSGANTPPSPTRSTTGPSTVSTAGAAGNRVGGALAALGMVAAWVL